MTTIFKCFLFLGFFVLPLQVVYSQQILREEVIEHKCKKILFQGAKTIYCPDTKSIYQPKGQTETPTEEGNNDFTAKKSMSCKKFLGAFEHCKKLLSQLVKSEFGVDSLSISNAGKVVGGQGAFTKISVSNDGSEALFTKRIDKKTTKTLVARYDSVGHLKAIGVLSNGRDELGAEISFDDSGKCYMSGEYQLSEKVFDKRSAISSLSSCFSSYGESCPSYPASMFSDCDLMENIQKTQKNNTDGKRKAGTIMGI